MTSTPVPSLQAPRRRATLQQRVLRGLVRQFGHPRGLPGRVVGGVMAHRSSNRRRNLWAVSLLDVQAADRVLEVGFGPGVAIDELARLAHHGAVYGIDHSDVMVRQATKRNRAAVRAGLVDLRLGSVDDLPAFAEPLDKILAVNSVGFWPGPWERSDRHCVPATLPGRNPRDLRPRRGRDQGSARGGGFLRHAGRDLGPRSARRVRARGKRGADRLVPPRLTG